ncbi:uncharacterized protein LOC133841848 [Drosophila sulfurigaster albostrigata]|uniref:uncharacterized protein LOC133841848 n=1 Tax=Drosophila sulfurigaster albostrigata TaxID=89887 RepID=UPI002D218959|nr:uncharacterized protein LOC133841848 [Drosophila sulfurigaster albostrigata]
MGQIDSQNKLDEFQKLLDVPKWYLGLSDYQETTIKQFADDLRDDFEQGTSFRIEKSLCRIGVSPLISKKKIRTMVQLSRGNDLAFLFFILEGYYISERKNGEYSTNEKLLMMTMAKIDLLPTLRELDRILPPPQLSALDLKRQQISEVHHQKTTNSQILPSKSSKKSQKLPYFQKQPRPKEIVVKYTSKPPNHIASFPFWRLNQPPQYGSPTEPPWFSDYNLNPVGRLVKSTVGEAVDKYFNHLNQIKLLEQKARVSRRAAAALERTKHTFTDEPQMCAYHQSMTGEMQLVKDELIVLARNRVMELLDVTMPYRKLRERRILAQLEHDVDVCMKRYALKMEHTTVHTLSKSDCVLCQAKSVTLPVPKPQDKEGRALVAETLHLANTDVTNKCVGVRLCGGGLRRESVNFEGELDPCEKSQQVNVKIFDPANPSCNSGKKNQQRISFLLDDRKMKQLRKNRKDLPVEVRFQGKQTKKTFFMAPTDHKPYLFKYKRIFKTNQEKPRDVNRVIAKAFVKALNEEDSPDPPCEEQPADTSEDDVDKLATEVSGCRLTNSCSSTGDTSDHSTHSHEDRKADIVNAVVRCAKEIWMKGVNIKRTEMERAEAEKAMKSTATTELKYETQNFDPDDSELMNRMLQDGMKELRKNQRYVLASLPNAHKLPVLQEWIKRRYGKQYTEAEVQKSIQESVKIFEMITMLQGRPPSADLMGMDQLPLEKENYNYAKAAKALGDKVRSAYYQKLNDMYMNHTRACWYAMGNYQCPGGPPRKVFYAYMSANTRDIMRNRVWNGEFRNIRQFRDNNKELQKGK